MGGENITFYGDGVPKKPAAPPTPEDPAVQENLKKAQQVERGQRGRASTVLTTRSMLGDPTVMRRSLLGQ